MTYAVVPEHEVIVVVHDGRLSDEEALAGHEAMRADPRVLPAYSYLVDLSTAVSEDRSAQGVQRLAQLGEHWRTSRGSRARIAVIAPRDVSFGLARMYQARANEHEDDFRVFRDAATAAAWLGVPLSVLEAVRGGGGGA